MRKTPSSSNPEFNYTLRRKHLSITVLTYGYETWILRKELTTKLSGHNLELQSKQQKGIGKYESPIHRSVRFVTTINLHLQEIVSE